MYTNYCLIYNVLLKLKQYDSMINKCTTYLHIVTSAAHTGCSEDPEEVVSVRVFLACSGTAQSLARGHQSVPPLQRDA